MKNTTEIVQLFPEGGRLDTVFPIFLPPSPKVEKINDPVHVRKNISPKLGYEGNMSKESLTSGLRIARRIAKGNGLTVDAQMPNYPEGWTFKMLATILALTGAEEARGLVVRVRRITA